jgi:hypothetical protein
MGQAAENDTLQQEIGALQADAAAPLAKQKGAAQVRDEMQALQKRNGAWGLPCSAPRLQLMGTWQANWCSSCAISARLPSVIAARRWQPVSAHFVRSLVHAPGCRARRLTAAQVRRTHACRTKSPGC